MTTNTEVFLHVGTMKSGTSYIQAVLRRNQPALAEAGVLPMTRLLAPVGEIRGRTGKKWPREFKGQWAKMMDAIDAWPGDKAVLSQEFLASSTLAEAQAVIEGLGDRKVTVIITGRDLLRNIPSHWQTSVRSNSTLSFAEFVEAVLSPPEFGAASKMGTGFWRNHDLARITETWAEAAGAENVVLITLPPSGGPRDRLWTDFAGVTGLDPAAYDAKPDAASNVSLTYSEAEMLRAVNKKVRGSLDALEYRRLVWRYLASKLLQKGFTGDDPSDRPQLSAGTHARIVERVEVMLADLRKLDVRVVGDLDDLRVRPFAGAADRDESSPPAHPVPAMASFVISKLLIRIAELERELAAGGAAVAVDDDLGDEEAAGSVDEDAEGSADDDAERARRRRKRKRKRRNKAAEA